MSYQYNLKLLFLSYSVSGGNYLTRLRSLSDEDIETIFFC